VGKWVADGVDLSTYATNISNRAAGWAVPGRRGANVELPNQHGARHVRNKVYEQGSLSLSMWAVGCLTDGTFPETPSRAEVCRENLERLIHVLTKPGGGLVDLQRIESPGFGAVNKMPNPGSEGFTSGPVLYRNEVVNPRGQVVSAQPMHMNMHPNPNLVTKSAFQVTGENLVMDPTSKAYRSATPLALETNYFWPSAMEFTTVGAAAGAPFVATSAANTYQTVSSGEPGTKGLRTLLTANLAAGVVFLSRTRTIGPTSGQRTFYRCRIRRGTVTSTGLTVEVRVTWRDNANAILGTPMAWQSHALANAGVWNTLHVPTASIGVAPTGATGVIVEFRTGTGSWVIGEGLYTDGHFVGKVPNLDSTTPVPYALDGVDEWGVQATADASNSDWLVGKVDPRWTVEPKTSAYHAFAVTPHNTATGVSLVLIASADVASGTQSFTLECAEPTPGTQYMMQFGWRSIVGTTSTVQLLYSSDGGATKTPASAAVSCVGQSATSTAAQGDWLNAGNYLGLAASTVIPSSSSDRFYIRVTIPVRRSGAPTFLIYNMGVNSQLGGAAGDNGATVNSQYAWSGTPRFSKTNYLKQIPLGMTATSPWIDGTSNGLNGIHTAESQWIGSGDGGLYLEDIPVDEHSIADGMFFSCQGWSPSSGSSPAAGTLFPPAPATVRWVVEAYDATDALLQTYTGANATPAIAVTSPPTLVELSIPFLPAATSYVRARVGMVSPTAGQRFWGQRFMVNNRAFRPGYAVGGGATNHLWEGAANASRTKVMGTYPTGWRAYRGVPTPASAAGAGIYLRSTWKDELATEVPASIEAAGLVNVGCMAATDFDCGVYAQAVSNGTVTDERFMGSLLGLLPSNLTQMQKLQCVLESPGDLTHVRIVLRRWTGDWGTGTDRYGRIDDIYVIRNADALIPRLNGNRMLNTDYVRGTAGWSTASNEVAVDTASIAIRTTIGLSLRTTGKRSLFNLGRIPVVAGDSVFAWAKVQATHPHELWVNFWTNGMSLVQAVKVDDTTSTGITIESGTAVVPATAVWATLQTRFTTFTGAEVLDLFGMYGVQVVANRDYLPTIDPLRWRYVDGSTGADSLGRAARWEGTADLSRTEVLPQIPIGWMTPGMLASSDPSVRPPGSVGLVVVVPGGASFDTSAVAGYTGGYFSGFEETAAPPTTEYARYATVPVARDGTWLSAQVALARTQVSSRFVVSLVGYDDETGSNPVVIRTTELAELTGIVKWQDVEATAAYYGLRVDYIEDETNNGIAGYIDNILLMDNADPIGNEYPGYFDGSRSSASWNGTANDSPSTFYGGARRAYGEVLDPITPSSMAAGTRAELEVTYKIPATFWQDLATTTMTFETSTGTTTFDLDDFAEMTAPLEDSKISIALTEGTATLTSIRLTDVASGAWLAIANPAPSAVPIIIDAGDFSVVRAPTNLIRSVTKGGPARFFTLNAPGYNLPPQLRVQLVGAFTGVIRINVTGTRKYQIA